MVSPTTKLQTPHLLVINNGVKEISYPIAETLVTRGGTRQLVRQWRREKRQIQQGQGELIKHWDSWDSGMGWSRDETRDALYAPAVYESGDATATRRGYIYPRLKQTTITLTGSATSCNRLAEIGGCIWAYSTVGVYTRCHKIDPSDDTVVNERNLGGFSFTVAPAGQTTEFGGYLYVPTSGGLFSELTTIVGDLTAAFLYNGSTYTNNTANANVDGGTPFTLLGDNSDDIFYWGCATKFDGVYIDIVTAANTALTLDWEYSKGSGVWADIVGPETDETTGFTADGWAYWYAALQTDWDTDTVNGVTGYFVRVKTSTAASTWPTSDWTPPADVWTNGPSTRPAWHLGTAGNLLWRVGDATAGPSEHYVVNSCAAISTGGAGGPLTADNWSDPADYVIGKPGRSINSIAELGRWPYFGKEEGLIGADSEGNQTNALDFSRNLMASTNCNDTIRWLGTLVTTHRGALWQHTGVSSRAIGVETLKGNTSAIKGGRYTALACCGPWLYTAYLVGTTTYLLAGRPGDDEEPPVVWYEMAALATTTVNAMLVSGLTTNAKLWIAATVSSAASLSYFILAKDGSPDPTDTGTSFEAQEATLDFPGVDWGMPGTPKRGHMVEVVTSRATGTAEAAGTIKVYYGWEGATPSTQLGATITSAGKSQRFWTAGTTDSGYRPQIRIGNTGHATNNLRVEKVSLYCVPLPRKEPIITTVVRCGDNLDKLRDAKTMYDDLEALENAGVYTVRDPDDPASGTFKVVVENIDEAKGEQLADYSGERLLSVTMRIVEYA